MNINRVTLQHNKESFFYLVFYNDVQSSKAFVTCGVLSTPASDVHERLKTNGTSIKISRETTDNP